MTQRSYQVERREKPDSDAWYTLPFRDKATPSEVSRFNHDHKWEKARLVLPNVQEEEKG